MSTSPQTFDGNQLAAEEHADVLGGRARARAALRAVRLVAGFILAATFAMAVGTIMTSGSRQGVPVLGVVPDFRLREASGRSLSRLDLAGKTWIADFVFTSCAASCPRMTAEMARLQESERGLADLRLVSFTVDPSTDTEDVLRAYAARHRADPARWFFVTGDPASLRDLAANGFHIAVADGDPSAGDAPIVHSSHLILVDGEARIRGYYDMAEPSAIDALRADLHRVAAEKKS
jgi:protein SCO1/2